MKVFYSGNFWGHHGRDHAGKELRVDKRFAWDGNEWCIPSVYVCAKGLVIDYCVAIEPCIIRAFVEENAKLIERGDELAEDEHEASMAKNPTSISFNAKLSLNGSKLIAENGCGASWYPTSCFDEESECEPEPEITKIIEYYNLDKNKAWLISRKAYKYASKSSPVLEALEVELSKAPVKFYSEPFKVSGVGEEIVIKHPLTSKEYVLSVQEYSKAELSNEHFAVSEYEHPTHYTQMVYTISPDASGSSFMIADVKKSESPRKKSGDKLMEDAKIASAIAIIGGADGPTSVILVPRVRNPKLHAACSALHFEPVEEVEWRASFSEKISEDIAVKVM